jgi:hypothetical protein
VVTVGGNAASFWRSTFDLAQPLLATNQLIDQLRALFPHYTLVLADCREIEQVAVRDNQLGLQVTSQQ